MDTELTQPQVVHVCAGSQHSKATAPSKTASSDDVVLAAVLVVVVVVIGGAVRVAVGVTVQDFVDMHVLNAARCLVGMRMAVCM